MILPKTIVKAESQNPRRLFIYSQPKVGKTSLCATLPNSLLIDLEHGSDFVDACKIKAKNWQEVKAIYDAIGKENEIAKKCVYDYIIIDTATVLEDMCRDLGLILYQNTQQGKNYKGNILSLPQGGGYQYLRDAFEGMLKKFDGLSKCLILLGHIKNASITKDDKEISCRDIDLTGKLKRISAQNVDTIGYMYRKGNQCIISFKTSEDDLASGSRSEHLRNKDIIVSELVEENGKEVLKTYWDRIFLNN